MKSNYYGILAFFMALIFTACSESDVESLGLVVNNAGSEVSVNRLGGTLQIPVKASGSWTATIYDNEDNEIAWCALNQMSGHGDGVISVIADYFSPAEQMHERKARVVVKSGDQSQEFIVRQYVGMKDGETVPNASQSYDNWFNKGVGSGYDVSRDTSSTKPYVDNDLLKATVLNTDYIIKVAKNPMYSTLFVDREIPESEVEVVATDSLEDNEKGLKVDASIDVKFAKFKLNIAVNYKNKGQQIENQHEYHGAHHLDLLNSDVSIADVQASLEDAWDERTQNWEPGDTLHNLVSIGFQGVWKNIMKDEISTDEASDFYKHTIRMFDKFGPAVVSGATLGGSVFTSLLYDYELMKDSFAVSGQMTAELALPVITIEGNVTVDYSKVGQDIWNNSSRYVSVSGGTHESQAALTNVLVNSDTLNLDGLGKAMDDWVKSLVKDRNYDNASVIKVKLTGIWNLFPDDQAEAIHEIAKNYYKGKLMCVKLDD